MQISNIMKPQFVIYLNDNTFYTSICKRIVLVIDGEEFVGCQLKYLVVADFMAFICDRGIVLKKMK